MADKIPLKVILTSGNTSALGEFNPGDTIPVEFGGTGVTNLTDFKTSIDLSGTNTGDQVIPTTLPASDVYAWAKAPVKPSYSFSEIVSLPTTIAGFGITDSYTKTQVDSYLGAKQDTLGVGSVTNAMLVNTAVANLSGTNTGDETLASIKSKLGITTLSGSNTGDQTTITGNAGTATKLQTARTIGGVSFDGSANITLTKTSVGLTNVDNTSDASKPISTAQQTALNLKAPLANPTFTGTLTHSGDVVLSGSGKRITGDFNNAIITNRVMFQSSTPNSGTRISAIPSGTGSFAQVGLHSLSDPTNSPLLQLTQTATEASLVASYYGTGYYTPLEFYTGGAKRVILSVDGVVTLAQGKLNVSSSYGALQVNGEDRIRFGSDNSGQLAGFRNILINGDMRINQRGVTIAAAANDAYGPDRWKKVDASNMTQIVEAGNFKVSSTYTLSGTGVTTQQITSPASGNWTIPSIPIAATKIQLEEGSIATPFENRPYGLELMLCQRYYETGFFDWTLYQLAGNGYNVRHPFAVTKRASPTMTITSPSIINTTTPSIVADIYSIGQGGAATATGMVRNQGNFQANAEL